MANHVLGSVLCSPGCFSVYRAAAIRDVLPIYSTKVDNSHDFLTKDMGKSMSIYNFKVVMYMREFHFLHGDKEISQVSQVTGQVRSVLWNFLVCYISSNTKMPS